MKAVGGIVLIVVGLVLGAYVGVWLCAIGGIVQFIEGIKADPVSAIDIAVGVVRFLCAAVAGFVSALVCIVPGAGMVATS